MATGGATEREFTAPAGSLTLLLAAGWPDREETLRLLEASRSEGLDVLSERREGDPGAELAHVTSALAQWLAAHPRGPLDLGAAGTEATVAMACCWSSAVTHALAQGPRTMSELCEEAECLWGEEIVREHVEALLRTDQADAIVGEGLPRYILTEWGAEGAAPLIAAARHETRFPTEDVLAPEILDVEATFQMVGPLLRLPEDLHGACRLSVWLPGEEPVQAGATVEVVSGRVASSTILLESEPATWAIGTPLQWCEAVVDPDAADRLETGGDTELAEALLTALHERLFGGMDSRFPR